MGKEKTERPTTHWLTSCWILLNSFSWILPLRSASCFINNWLQISTDSWIPSCCRATRRPFTLIAFLWNYLLLKYLLASRRHLKSRSNRIHRRNCTRSSAIGPSNIGASHRIWLLTISHSRRRIWIYRWIHRRRWVRIHWLIHWGGLRTSITKGNSLISINYNSYTAYWTDFVTVVDNMGTRLHNPKMNVLWKYPIHHWGSMVSYNVDNWQSS